MRCPRRRISTIAVTVTSFAAWIAYAFGATCFVVFLWGIPEAGLMAAVRRASVLWRKRQSLNAILSVAYSEELDSHLHQSFQSFAAIVVVAALARQLHRQVGQSASDGDLAPFAQWSALRSS